MNTVLGITPKGDKAAILSMQDGTKVWTPEKEKAEGLMGKEIPADWTIKQGDYGPQAFPPREKKGFGPGGGAAAFRNTKEGQAIEQERMDRRTALMQAVAALGDAARVESALGLAEAYYTWLREPTGTAGTAPAVPSGTPVVHTQPMSSTAAVGMRGATGREQGEVSDSSEAVAASSCSHNNPAFVYPNGRQVPDGKFYCPDCRKLVKG